MFKVKVYFLASASFLTAFIVLNTLLNKNTLLNMNKYKFITRDNEIYLVKGLTAYLSRGKLQLQNYDLLPKIPCPEDTDILVVTISQIDNHKARDRIRNCWRGDHMCDDSFWTMCHHNSACDLNNLRLVFITGRSSNVTIQQNLEDEHFQFDDIIQGTFNDTYRNLVHKSVLMLDYAVNYCKSAKFIQKIDSDVYLNMSTLSHLLVHYPDTPEGYVIGHAYHRAPVRRKGKWQISETEYMPHHYPDYLNGASYIISRNATTTLLNVARNLSLVHNEDAFITGICRNKTNVKIKHSSQFCTWKEARNCATLHYW